MCIRNTHLEDWTLLHSTYGLNSSAQLRAALPIGALMCLAGCDIVGPGDSNEGCRTIWTIEGVATADSTSDERVSVIAHRGFADCFPENTVESIRGAISLGFPSVELDVRTTRDTRLVLMHDSTVTRTTTGVGYVSNLSLADLSKVNACPRRPDPCRIPTLSEALTPGGTKISFLLDLKGEFSREARARMIEVITAAGVMERTRLLSGSIPLLYFITREHPSVSTAFVYILGGGWEHRHAQTLSDLEVFGVETVVMFIGDIVAYPDVVAELDAEGFEVVAATVNTRAELDEVYAVGLRNVLSDVPIRALAQGPGVNE